MAKLYWRVKKNGKWTWKAATVIAIDVEAIGGPEYLVKDDGALEEEE